jgi:hemerythrin-like domain-containing protein
MQRYNTFNQIHKAMRALLYDAALCLQQTDFTVSEACDAVVEKVAAILDLFEEHAHNEDSHILPAIEMFEPAVADAFEQEHVTDLQLSKALQEIIARLYRTKNEREKVQLGKQLTSAFIQFMIFNLNHMAKEEDVLNGFLWKYYSDAEIKAIEQVIVRSTPPEKQPFVAKWMLRGISNSEAVQWLSEVQRHAPAARFELLFSLAKTELPAKRFEQITALLSERAMPVSQ